MALPIALLIANVACSVIDILGTYIVALLFRVTVTEVRLFRLPFLRFQLGLTAIAIGCIPIGGCVRFNSAESKARDLPESNTRLGYFEDLSPFEKLIISLGGPLAIFILCAIVLSPWHAFLETLEGFVLFFRGTFEAGFREYAFSRGHQIISSDTYSTSIALFLTKYLAINLLPLPPFRGYDLVRQSISWIVGHDWEAPQSIVIFSIVISLAITTLWLVHLAIFIL